MRSIRRNSTPRGHLMTTHLTTTPWSEANGDWLIVGFPESFELAGAPAALDRALAGQIGRLRESQDFTGKLAESVALPAPAGIRAKRLLLIGLGASEKID